VKILTGNDLKTGAVVWWDGANWSPQVNDAVDVGDQNEAYAIDATQAEGGVRPAHIKDRIRALGPTVRLDLSHKPGDPAAGSWVI
jgi:Protein of unknown function (DUF2849)